MVVGVVRLTLMIPDNDSLKGNGYDDRLVGGG